jgi:hypothetical protein
MRKVLGIGLLLFSTACEQPPNYSLQETDEGLYRFNQHTGELVLIDRDVTKPVGPFPALELTRTSNDETDDVQYKLSANNVGERVYYTFKIFLSDSKEWKDSNSRIEFLEQMRDYNYTIIFRDQIGNELTSTEASDMSQQTNGVSFHGSFGVSRAVLERIKTVSYSFNVDDFDGDLRTKQLNVAFGDLIKDKPASQ